jgi:hypothetical protein
LLEGGVAGRGEHARGCPRTDHAALQLGDLAQGVLDDVLDRADLRGDFERGILDHLLAHDSSFPKARGTPAPGP